MDTEKMEKRRRRFNTEDRPKLQGKVSKRAELLITRCYLYGILEKPLEAVTDAEFLSIGDVGPKTLAEVRKIIPAPIS